MNAGQYEGIVGRLDAILGKMPAAPVPVLTRGPRADQVIYDDPPPVRAGWPYDREGPAPVPAGNAGCASVEGIHNHARCQTKTRPTRGMTRNDQETGAYLALVAMLQMLDGWVQGAKENHEAMGHRHENTDEECWRTFAPGDIRNMINDAATELGLAKFAAPTTPEEDKAL